MSHVWGLFSHPDREMQVINRENETISHHYTHTRLAGILAMALS